MAVEIFMSKHYMPVYRHSLTEKNTGVSSINKKVMSLDFQNKKKNGQIVLLYSFDGFHCNQWNMFFFT